MTDTLFKWVKLIIGAIMFGAIFYVDTYIKDVNVFLYAIPGALMGITSETLPWLKK